MGYHHNKSTNNQGVLKHTWILSRMRCAILALLLASGMAAAGEISVDVTAEYEEFLATTGLQDVEDTETDPLDRTNWPICGFFGNGRCATACNGQLCTSTCRIQCGLLRVVNVLC